MAKLVPFEVIPVSDWPAEDRAGWEAVLTLGGLLDDAGALAGRDAWSTIQLRAAYGRWLGFLIRTGIDLRSSRGLDHFSRENVAAFVKELNAVLAPYTVRGYLTNLHTVARAMAPDRSFEPLRGAVRHIWRTATPRKDKRGRLVPSRDLYDYGFELMERAGLRSTPLKDAGQFRDGLMIALLAARPLRRRNFAAIEIGRHLEHRGDFYWLIIPARETKTGRALEFPLPRSLTGPMDFYLTYYRPFLINTSGRWKEDPGAALWVSDNGSQLKISRLHQRISQRTRERFGRPINMHLFRDAAATSIAIEDPEHVGIVMAILGHSTIQMGETHYNQATSIEVARRYQDVIGTYR